MAKIEIRNVYKIFGPHPKKNLALLKQGLSKDELLDKTGHTVGLDNVSLDVEEGKTFVVMGLSGSGKSTLIRHLNRLIDPSAGEIKIDGVDIMSLSRKELIEFRRHRTSMVFQGFGLFPHKDVLSNVSYGLTVKGVPKAERQKEAQKWIDAVGLTGYEDTYPAQCSGGMKQRVGLARALATNADIMLMDEAFSALDPLIRREMQDLLTELQRKLRKTIIFITHDLDEALRLGDRIAILKDGVVVQVGAPEEILLKPADDYVEAFVKDVNRGLVLTVETAMVDPAVVVQDDVMPSDVLQQIEDCQHDIAYVVDDEQHLKGVVTAEDLQGILEKDGANCTDCDGVLQEVPTVTQDTVLEEALPMTLESPWPMGVLCEKETLVGILPRKNMIAALVDSDGSHSN